MKRERSEELWTNQIHFLHGVKLQEKQGIFSFCLFLAIPCFFSLLPVDNFFQDYPMVLVFFPESDYQHNFSKWSNHCLTLYNTIFWSLKSSVSSVKRVSSLSLPLGSLLLTEIAKSTKTDLAGGWIF